MRHWFGVALLIAGLIVGWYGWREYRSQASHPADNADAVANHKALWLLGLAGLLIVVGIGAAARKST